MSDRRPGRGQPAPQGGTIKDPAPAAWAPSPWRPLLRLFMEAVEIAFVVGLHAFLRWWVHVTHQEHDMNGGRVG